MGLPKAIYSPDLDSIMQQNFIGHGTGGTWDPWSHRPIGHGTADPRRTQADPRRTQDRGVLRAVGLGQCDLSTQFGASAAARNQLW